MSKLHRLAEAGQSIWLDFIHRPFLREGRLEELVEKGVRGVTSNPSIFDKAISGSGDYDEAIRALAGEGKSAGEIYEALAVQDVATAADQLRPVYDRTDGADGFVSLEVSPALARNAEGTVQEARRLFGVVGRPNLMIKVPATAEGLPAVSELLGLGVNVNVTLLFGVENYRRVAEAFMKGLERLLDRGPLVPGGHPVQRVASVASFFVSRVDTAVDEALEAIDRSGGGEHGELRGTIAVANAKRAYLASEEIFGSERWGRLAESGARKQRLLWASTSTKNPAYPDTMYVDELIGPDTVNTVPPETLDAFLDHGRVAVTLPEGTDEARRRLRRLETVGIDLDAVTEKLQADGVAKFADAFDSLLAGIEEKRRALRRAAR